MFSNVDKDNRIYIYNLSSDYKSIVGAPQIYNPPGIFVRIKSFDFTPNNNSIMYTTREQNGVNLTYLYNLSTQANTPINLAGSEVRRGKNGKMYVSVQGQSKLLEIASPYTSVSNEINITPTVNFSGGMPLQNHKIYSQAERLNTNAYIYVAEKGKKMYEISNPVTGNVHVVISDKKLAVDDNNNGTIDYYTADVLAAYNYYSGVGQLMPGRVYEGIDYKYGAQGSEVDKEREGSRDRITTFYRNGNLKTMRWDSVDPLASKYPDESPYIFSGNSPISVTDEDGREKTYYMTRIAKDGTTTRLKVVEKYTVIQQTTYSRESIGAGGVTFFTSPQISNTKTFDVAQHITLDERTGKVTVGKEYATTERSNSAIVRGLEDNAQQLGNYLDEATNGGGGIVFTSSEGQGQETRSGYNADAQSENIDLLTAVLGAASSAATSKQAVGFLESFKQGVEAIGILKDVKDNTIGSSSGQGQAPADKDSCTFCGQTGSGLKTFEQGGSHGGPIVPAKSEKKED